MSRSYIAGGNVAPSVFVTPDTSVVGGQVVQAGAGDKVFGISQPGTRQAPLAGLDDGFCAIAGQGLMVLDAKDVGWLQIGGTVTFGDFLKPTTGGVGVTTTSDGDFYGARALESGVSGDLINVEVMFGFHTQ